MNKTTTPQTAAPSITGNTSDALEMQRKDRAVLVAELQESVTNLRAEIAYRRAYLSRLTELVQLMLPAGIQVPDDLSMPDFSVPAHTANHAALERLAKKAAIEDAEIGYSLSIENWVARGVLRLRERFGANEERSERLLLAALDELHDAKAIKRCVLFWIRLGTDRMPPDWETLNSLLDENPGLLENGLQEMANHGFVAPSWLTAAIS